MNSTEFPVSRVSALLFASLVTLTMAACNQPAPPTAAPAPAPAAPPAPQPVDGWIEYPSTDAIARTQPARWRSDTVNIPLPPGRELEYKIDMKKGDVVAYAISYGKLKDPASVVSEFHGHTEKRADGVGDLMYYAKTNGTAQQGQLVAPWDGIHGWYLKNSSEQVITVKLELAGFYDVIPDQF